MRPKLKSAIEKITLNAATFDNVQITPTLINFFYGKNGTGKSTIAQVIKEDNGIEWQLGKTADDYAVLVYNQDFISTNIRSYANMPGVFTISKQNADVEDKIAAERERQHQGEAQFREFKELKTKKEAERSSLQNSFEASCWNLTKVVREQFPEVVRGSGVLKSKSKFAEELLKIQSAKEHDTDELKAIYKTAYDNSARVYPLFKKPSGLTLPTSELLEEPILNSSDSPFGGFLRTLQAADWVRQGHDLYQHTAGDICPYCQQKLPDDFEERLAKSFDQEYRKSLFKLSTFKEAYDEVSGKIINAYKGNVDSAFPELDIKEYQAKISQLEAVFNLNASRIEGKSKEPVTIVKLDDVDIIISDLNKLIDEFNTKIQKHNDVVNAKQQKQAECKTELWEHMAFLLEAETSSYQTSKKNLDGEIWSADCKMKAGSDSAKMSREEIKRLNLQYANTQIAADSINTLIKNSGFQGFHIREKEGTPNAYEVVREDNSIAANLSEGERNFIAFLYFYHLVRGSDTAENTEKKKIVVIDDPVTSMDSGVMYVVAALVREMVEACYNTACYRGQRLTGDYVEQLFVLTHNAFFHKEVTYNQAQRYEWVTFFKVEKAGNRSSCTPCVRDIGIDEKENYNPVQNSYAALWREYEEVRTPIPLMNVIHRILDYYFLQMCGYDGMNIRKAILEENRDKFVIIGADGQPDDYTKYHLASSMLQYIATGTNRITDGLDFVDDCVDVEQCRKTFEMIFENLGQKQHFDMMMLVNNRTINNSNGE